MKISSFIIGICLITCASFSGEMPKELIGMWTIDLKASQKYAKDNHMKFKTLSIQEQQNFHKSISGNNYMKVTYNSVIEKIGDIVVDINGIFHTATKKNNKYTLKFMLGKNSLFKYKEGAYLTYSFTMLSQGMALVERKHSHYSNNNIHPNDFIVFRKGKKQIKRETISSHTTTTNNTAIKNNTPISKNGYSITTHKGDKISLTLKSGLIFNGIVSEVNDDEIILDRSGNLITFTKDAISKVIKQ